MKLGRRFRQILLERLIEGLTLRKLALVGIFVPFMFLVIYSYWILGPGQNLLQSIWGVPLLISFAGMAVVAFSSLIFGAVGRLQRNIERLSEVASRRNAQLRALNEANLALSEEMVASSVLQRVSDLSCQLVKARYAALSVVGSDGKIRTFHTSGIDPETRRAMGDPPSGRGILGIILKRTTPLRLDRISDHPSSEGFPPGHPQMETFLGVPIRHKDRVVGSLYLAEKLNGGPFTEEDEEIAQLFANQAAVAIMNAQLYEQIQVLAVETERTRISREMHDGLAQVLSFVNTKAQAVEAYLSDGNAKAAQEHVRELGMSARKVYQDVREGILALRTQVGEGRNLSEVLAEYISEYEYQSRKSIKVNYRGCDGELALLPSQEVQVLRIIQEALTNVRKHASATEVDLNFVSKKEGKVLIEILDNGKGFDPLSIERNEWPHFGLQTMAERAEAIGGSFEIDSAIGKGTTVRVFLPNDAQIPMIQEADNEDNAC